MRQEAGDMNVQESTIEIVKKCQDKNGSRFEYDAIEGIRKVILSEITKASIATEEVTEFDWDHQDRLVGVVIRPSINANPTSTISYKYDAFNRRIEKNVNGTITRYVYDRGNIVFEYDGENTFQAKYVHSDNIDEPVTMIRPENPYVNAKFPAQEFYYHRDRLGNITEITDFEGTVVQRYVYDAFGKISIFDKDGNAITPNSANYLKSPYAFTGREYDHETGMYFYRARYYDPDSGRFISEDPIGFGGQDANLYRYVGNNSVNFVDPEGEKIISFAVCSIGLAVGTAIDNYFTISNSDKRRNEALGRIEDEKNQDKSVCPASAPKEYNPESYALEAERERVHLREAAREGREVTEDAVTPSFGRLGASAFCVAVIIGSVVF